MPDAPRPLTRRQREIYSFIATRIRSLGYSPTYDEIAKHFGFRSLATVDWHIKHLVTKGYIRKRFNAQRAIELVATDGRCPHCGTDLSSHAPGAIDSYLETDGARIAG